MARAKLVGGDGIGEERHAEAADAKVEMGDEDRNRITGAGVTAGLDLGLHLAAKLRGPDAARMVQLIAQSVQTLDNIAAILKSQGLGMDDVFKCTVMLSDMSKWSDFNKIYVRYFKPGRLPARSAMGVNGLAANAFVELECWAHANRAKP